MVRLYGMILVEMFTASTVLFSSLSGTGRVRDGGCPDLVCVSWRDVPVPIALMDFDKESRVMEWQAAYRQVKVKIGRRIEEKRRLHVFFLPQLPLTSCLPALPFVIAMLSVHRQRKWCEITPHHILAFIMSLHSRMNCLSTGERVLVLKD